MWLTALKEYGIIFDEPLRFPLNGEIKQRRVRICRYTLSLPPHSNAEQPHIVRMTLLRTMIGKVNANPVHALVTREDGKHEEVVFPAEALLMTKIDYSPDEDGKWMIPVIYFSTFKPASSWNVLSIPGLPDARLDPQPYALDTTVQAEGFQAMEMTDG